MGFTGTEFFLNAVENADVSPLIVAGDFNVPSHEDWTEKVSAV